MNKHILRYLSPNETVDQFFHRVIDYLFPESSDIKEEIYHALKNMEFIFASPILMNAGTPFNQLSSCFMIQIGDSLEDIGQSFYYHTCIGSQNGNLSMDYSAVRSSIFPGKRSDGMMPFLYIVESLHDAFYPQHCGISLADWHLDMIEFLHVPKRKISEHVVQRILWLSDLFMERVMHNRSWVLFDPKETQYILHHSWGDHFRSAYLQLEKNKSKYKHLTISARSLWKMMLKSMYSMPYYGIAFKDTINRDNPQNHMGMIHQTNLSTELTLQTNEKVMAMCNMGTINLAQVKDEEHLLRLVRIGVIALNRVIDKSHYPLPEDEEIHKTNRPIGLGVMGLADYLYQRDLHFLHEDAPQVIDQLFHMIKTEAVKTSSLLASLEGCYPNWTHSIWEKKTIKMRNSHVLALAPTEYLSRMAGCCTSISPLVRVFEQTTNFKGETKIVINPHLKHDLRKANIDPQIVKEQSIQHLDLPEWIKKKYQTAFEVDQKTLIDLASIRQRHICQSQALPIFMNSKQTIKDLDQYCFYAWKKQVKSIYHVKKQPEVE